MQDKGLLGALLLAGALVPVAAQAEISEMTVEMSGAEVPGGGDPDGSATFKAEFDTEYGDLCYTVTVNKVAGTSGVHIHEGKAGETGKSVVDLLVTGRDGDLCRANQPDLLIAILEKPWEYYIDVHSSQNPDGAVRAQLGEAPAAGDPAEAAEEPAEGEAATDAAPADEAAVEGEAAPAPAPAEEAPAVEEAPAGEVPAE